MSKLREQILSCQDIQSEHVTVPEWGGVVVEVRGMTGTQRDKYLSKIIGKSGKAEYQSNYADLLIPVCFDPETSEAIFEPTDRDALNSKAASATERLAKVAMRLSGMGDDELEVGKAGSPPESGDSTSTSPLA